MHVYMYAHISIHIYIHTWHMYTMIHVCLISLHVVFNRLNHRSLFAKELYERDDILQKRPIILSIPTIVGGSIWGGYGQQDR